MSSFKRVWSAINIACRHIIFYGTGWEMTDPYRIKVEKEEGLHPGADLYDSHEGKNGF